MCTSLYDLPAEVRELYHDDTPSPRPMVSFTAAPARFAPVPVVGPTTMPVFTIADSDDPRTLGELVHDGLAIARQMEDDGVTEMRVAFVRDGAGRINGFIFGARVAF